MARRIGALIVDDERLARERVRSLLVRLDEIAWLDECSDGREAVRAIRAKKPDLVFLDVQMPELDGFGVVQEIGPQAMPAVIFVTAHDEHAVQAFEVHALDYLVKPFTPERFEEAVRRAIAMLPVRDRAGADRRLEHLVEHLRSAGERVERVLIRKHNRIVIVRMEDVDWIEAARNYACLHAGKANHLLRQTMNSLEQRLDPRRFLRIHRSTIVNVDRIEELRPLPGGDYTVVLQDGTELTLSRKYRDRLDGLDSLLR